MSHGDKVTALPPGFKLIASNEACPIAGMADERDASTRCSSIPRSRTRSRARDLHALRARDLRRGPSWNMPQFVPQAVQRIREQVGRTR
jgi:GMP synthase (glutamine-hydrolysing)